MYTLELHTVKNANYENVRNILKKKKNYCTTSVSHVYSNCIDCRGLDIIHNQTKYTAHYWIISVVRVPRTMFESRKNGKIVYLTFFFFLIFFTVKYFPIITRLYIKISARFTVFQ